MVKEKKCSKYTFDFCSVGKGRQKRENIVLTRRPSSCKQYCKKKGMKKERNYCFYKETVFLYTIDFCSTKKGMKKKKRLWFLPRDFVESTN